MHFALTDDQEHLRRTVRELAATFTDEYWAARDEQHEFPWEFYDTFSEGGWLGIAIPEQYGGGGLGILEAALLLEEVAASGAGMNGMGRNAVQSYKVVFDDLSLPLPRGSARRATGSSTSWMA
jgi:alkylation response protein AidB-like acyl-CoA dehydrogenase